MTLRSKLISLLTAAITFVAAPASFAQNQASNAAWVAPLAATAPTPVPALIPYSGIALGRDGHALNSATAITFLIYTDQHGGQPLFIETQSVVPDALGNYTARLGASMSNGIPVDLFASGQARWLEVQIPGEVEQPRVLLASVPYALKAADATTLGGLPASAFVLAGSAADASLNPAAAVNPDAVSTVTTTGGVANKVAKFSGANTIVSSSLYDNGTEVGIGTTAPTSTLTVNGTSAFSGAMNINPAGTATASGGVDSQQLKIFASAYNSSSKAAVMPHFIWQVEPTGNNTSTTGGTLNLLASPNSGGSVETGFYLNSNGTIHFSPSQIFPGGPGLGTITAVKTSAPLTGSATSGSVTLGLNVAELETSLNPVYAGLATANAFKSSATFAGPVSGNSGVLAHAAQGYGVRSSVDEANANYASIFGQANGASGAYSSVTADSSVSAGVWGDIANSATVSYTVGVVGTTDNGWAGYYANNSLAFPTIEAYNYNSGDVGTLFKTFKAGGPGGACGISGQGNLSCTGQVKTLVSTRSGQHTVETYAVQSPENWIEDFGAAELLNGSATVAIDPSFAETVSGSNEYHVFLTPRGDSKGLYVTNLTPTTFEVRESGSGTASIGFDYRIVSKRRGFEAQRLTDVSETFKKEMATTPGRIRGGKLVMNTVP